MAYDFTDYVAKELFVNDPSRAAEVRTALDTLYQDMVAANPNKLSESSQAIKVDRALEKLKHELRSMAGSLVYRIDIENELDFSGGDPAYSVAPRLLFAVPERKRNPEGQFPIALASLFNGPAAKLNEPVTTDKTVLLYFNQEGEEEKIEDRPNVQKVAVSPGDYVILGKVGMKGREAVWNTVRDVMKTAEGVNPFSDYDARGTVEDLAEIMQSLRRQGFGNQYNTYEKIRTALANNGQGFIQPLPGRDPEASQISGFYAKPTDKSGVTVRYVPGDVLLVGNGRGREMIKGGGFAVYEDLNGLRRYSPASRGYAKLSMIFKRTKDPVVPENEAAPLKFKPDHALQGFDAAVAKFLTTLSGINKKYAAEAQPETFPGILPGLAGPQTA
ncbi:MAG TPA: hypothetical protein VL625_00510 [Patescibacteria group bacterium]|nr:hypothetical protein [Patescibacteria group bacterium]